jgi:nitroreductase
MRRWAVFSIDRDLEKGSWLDYGMFLEAIMVAARQFGLETCPQAAWLIFYDVLQRRLGIPPDQTVVCGMALGYPDPDDKVNTFTPERMPVGEFVTWVERLNAKS